ncbi:hypothetical protein NLJ89_g3585 [Agrocybe chaxingu]|uniref:Uncharacterized protein n=1 Tax=Agrocybe chaxingu TaxID=84603 RepID=A0A9W8MVD0_9AGAR|nr:hypothetical protein NLJ89_g3585 [Agrocybe chaxingu]
MLSAKRTYMPSSDIKVTPKTSQHTNQMEEIANPRPRARWEGKGMAKMAKGGEGEWRGAGKETGRRGKERGGRGRGDLRCGVEDGAVGRGRASGWCSWSEASEDVQHKDGVRIRALDNGQPASVRDGWEERSSLGPAALTSPLTRTSLRAASLDSLAHPRPPSASSTIYHLASTSIDHLAPVLARNRQRHFDPPLPSSQWIEFILDLSYHQLVTSASPPVLVRAPDGSVSQAPASRWILVIPGERTRKNAVSLSSLPSFLPSPFPICPSAPSPYDMFIFPHPPMAGEQKPSSMADPNDATKPTVIERSVNLKYRGDKLDRAKSNWQTWSRDIEDELNISGLGSYLESEPPSSTLYPNAHRNWTTNDRAARGFLRRHCEVAERELIENLKSAKECWTALQTYHKAEGPIAQVNLIQRALNTRISRSDDMVTKARSIREDIRKAFSMPGGITEDTFTCIAVLNALDSGFDTGRSIITREMRQAPTEKPYTADRLIAYLGEELTILQGEKQCNTSSTSSTSIALTAQTSNTKLSSKPKTTCSNCKRDGHAAEWCVRSGGGMAGKSIAESIEMRRKAKNTNNTTPSTSAAVKTKPTLSVPATDSNGKAFFINVDSQALIAMAAEASKSITPGPEFAGIASDAIPDALINEAEHIEWEGWLACEEEIKATIDWQSHSRQNPPPSS